MNEKSNLNLLKLRRAVAFVLAKAVAELYENVKFGETGITEDGFYHDFKFEKPLPQEALQAIEERMKELIRSGGQVNCKKMSIADCRELFSGQPYLPELIKEREEIALWSLGEFHLPTDEEFSFSFNELDPGSFLLQRVSGAYWRGDSQGDMLTRVSGTAFESAVGLGEHLSRLEELMKRDHRTLGSQLELFSSSPDIGQGLALWHPKGAMVRFQLEKFSQQAHILNGYDWVYSPHIGRSELWQTSGHLSFYKDSMYNPILIDNEEYYLKPMNCPFHIAIYKSSPKSYRDLPVRYAEFGTVYRYELSGALQGLTRVRGFTQDDAHIICTPDQVGGEVLRALRFSLYILRAFGLEHFKAYISTKPEHKSIGSVQDWDDATQALKEAVEAAGLPYGIDEGGGAFYGPKIDLKLYDTLGREWQCSTIQFDFNLPQRFEMRYTASDGSHHTPMMVHRALFGSLERFFAMLIEHYNGEFPLWLAPVQFGIVPIREGHNEYAHKIERVLKIRGLRVKVDDSGDQMRAKIRRMELQKLPLILVIGDKEQSEGEVSVRSRREIAGKVPGNLGMMSLDSLFDLIEPELKKGQPEYLNED